MRSLMKYLVKLLTMTRDNLEKYLVKNRNLAKLNPEETEVLKSLLTEEIERLQVVLTSISLDDYKDDYYKE